MVNNLVKPSITSPPKLQNTKFLQNFGAIWSLGALVAENVMDKDNGQLIRIKWIELTA
jgi:hypothetical protein